MFEIERVTRAPEPGSRWRCALESGNLSVPHHELGCSIALDEPSGEHHKQLQDHEPIEVGVPVPGVLVLLAVLLAVPFQDRYSEVAQFERVALIVALVAASLSSVLLVATRLSHRPRFRLEDEDKFERLGNGLGIAGLSLLAVAMVASVLVVASFLFGRTTGIATAGSMAAFVIVVWYGFALRG